MVISDADNAAFSEIGQTCIFDAWLAGRCGRRCWRGRNQVDLKQIRKDRVFPVVSPTDWGIMRAVTSPCRPAPWPRHLPLRRAASEGTRGSSARYTTGPNLAGAISLL